jgi:hypothetical protein
VSRRVSNLGSSFGTAIAGTILGSELASGNTLALVVLAALALIGLAAAARFPRGPEQHRATTGPGHRSSCPSQ